jgi:hypothetical protein
MHWTGKLILLCAFVALLLLAPYAFTQTTSLRENETTVPVQLSIPPKASIQLSGSDLNFDFVPGKGTQQLITPKSAGKLWINYSSIVDKNTTNSICASLNTNNLPAEITIKLYIGPDVGGGIGQTGIPVAPLILNSSPQPIITNIGSCFTGQGPNKGHLLTYTWEVASNYDPSIINLDSLKIEAGVIYTIVTNE